MDKSRWEISWNSGRVDNIIWKGKTQVGLSARACRTEPNTVLRMGTWRAWLRLRCQHGKDGLQDEWAEEWGTSGAGIQVSVLSLLNPHCGSILKSQGMAKKKMWWKQRLEFTLEFNQEFIVLFILLYSYIQYTHVLIFIIWLQCYHARHWSRHVHSNDRDRHSPAITENYY